MHGASPSRDDRGPLSLAARASVYALLVALVGASFAIAPLHTSRIAAPAASPDRVVTFARAMIRAPRDVADVQLAPAAPSEVAPLVADAPSADAENAPVVDPLAMAEQRMLALINASRSRAGLGALVLDGYVAAVARAHSAAEARVRYVYHDGPDGTARSRDAAACGTGWFGENTGKVWNDNVEVLHREFMTEPWDPINHRTNIMDASFRRAGIGAVLGPDAMYMTMVFCR